MDVQRFIQLFGGLILHSTPHLYCSKSFSPDAAHIAAGLNDRAVGCMHAHVDLDLDGEFCPAVLGPWLRPELSQSQLSLAALARPGIFASPSCLKPGQSRGFRAKPGQNITTPNMCHTVMNLMVTGGHHFMTSLQQILNPRCMLIGSIDVANFKLPESGKARELPMQLSKGSGYGYWRAAGL
ncbi:hypothetical protein BDR05DRAFT_948793 [Suillus weaverae]|nr:hypothetical protein BDR05DRAFT_948793 [Suillus weaverae]